MPYCLSPDVKVISENALGDLEVISKIMSEQDNYAGQMNKAEIVFSDSFKAYQDTPIILQPGKQAFNFPASAITAEFPPVLGLLFAVQTMRRNQFNALCGQLPIQRVTVIGLIANQTLGIFVRKASLQGWLDQRDFMRCSTANGYGDRKTRAVCHCHELRTFAPLGLSHPLAPFFASTKVPSMKHSLTSRPPRSFRSCARVCKIFSNTPDRTHSWKRRWQVW